MKKGNDEKEKENGRKREGKGEGKRRRRMKKNKMKGGGKIKDKKENIQLNKRKQFLQRAFPGGRGGIRFFLPPSRARF